MCSKGLGHAILGNFSTDQIVIELTKLSKWRLKTIEELYSNKTQKSQVETWMDKTGDD